MISLVVLALAVYARYPAQLAGSWRWIYVATAVAAQYFNVFVLVVQMFQKIPSLKLWRRRRRSARSSSRRPPSWSCSSPGEFSRD